MPINPRQLPNSKDGRLYDRVGALERRMGSLERGDANTVQRAYCQKLTNTTGITASRAAGGVNICSVSLNVPSADALVLFWAWGTMHGSDATTRCSIIVKDDIDQTLGIYLGGVIGTSDFAVYSTYVPQSGSTVIQGASYGLTPWNYYQVTPGDHTFTFAGFREAGTGTGIVSEAHLWVVVL